MPTELHDKAHIDVFDRAARENWALRFGVTEERLPRHQCRGLSWPAWPLTWRASL